MMLSRGNDFRWLRDAKLPDTRTHRSKAYVAAGATRPKNETSTGPGSWQSLEMSSSMMVRAEGAAMLRRLTDCQRPRCGGQDMLADAREAQPLLLVTKFAKVSAISSWAEPARVRGRHVRVRSRKEPQMRQS
jgi:hypothetical protein